MSINQLISFYENAGKEEFRLKKDGPHYLEFLTASAYIEHYLPSPCRVLDSCAGIGIYSFQLAQVGHEVVSCDLVPYNVDIIRARQEKNPVLSRIICANAIDLPMLDSGSFQAVLCMGALYHLNQEEQRRQVVRESLRLLMPGGTFICTYLNRHGVILQNCADNMENLDEILQFTKDGRSGVFYAATPAEIETLMNEAGLTRLCHLALDGMSAFLHKISGRINKDGLRQYYEYHRLTCEDPYLLGSGYHNMYICSLPERHAGFQSMNF
jgi:2-polyprenyl-3-methyl-5-hydroxy-6-metoxy-1,4-benzoquinol methylase